MSDKKRCKDCKHQINDNCHYGHQPFPAPMHREHNCEMWEEYLGRKGKR